MDKRLFYSASLSNYHFLERFWKERGMFFALESSHCTSCRVLLDICSSALQQAGQLSKAIQDLVGTLLINLRQAFLRPILLQSILGLQASNIELKIYYQIANIDQ